MKKKFKYVRANWIWLLICAALAGLTVLAACRSLIIGMDADEQYAVTLAYRLVKGDLMIQEIWDPHQTSAMLPALLIKIFLFFSGDNTFLLLYLRMAGILFQAVVSFIWYRVMRSEYGKRPALLTALVLFHTLPKWIVTPEFANQQLLFWILTILCLYRFETGRKIRYCIYAGIALCFTVLAYPSCVLLFVPYVIWLGRRERRGAILLTLTCAAGAGIFMGFLFSNLSFPEFGLYMKQILADPTHSAGLPQKLGAYCREAAGLSLYLLIYLMIGLIIFYIVSGIFRKRSGRKEVFRGKDSAVFCLVLCIAAVDQVRMWLFEHTPTVHPQLHYLILYAMGGFLYNTSSEEKKQGRSTLYSLAWLPSLAGLGAVLLLTNLDLKASFVHLLPGMLAALLFWCEDRNDKASRRRTQNQCFSRIVCAAGGGMSGSAGKVSCSSGDSRRSKAICRVMGGCCGLALPLLWVLFLIGARGYLVRADEGMPANVFLVKQKALYGAVKNVYCSYMTGYQYNSDYLFITENLEPGIGVLYIGRELPIVYLINDMEVCAPSVISTPVFDKRYLRYYEMNPAKKPEAIIIDKGYFQAMEKSPGFIADWVKEEYDWEQRKESEFLWIVEMR